MKIGNNTFELAEGVKVRQAQGIASVAKEFSEGKIDEMTMAVKTIAVMLRSINGNSDKTTFEDFLFDELETDELEILTNATMEIVNEFVKKKTTSSTNMKPSSTEVSEISPKSGE